MKRVSKFESDDGQLFDTENEARINDLKVKLNEKVNFLLGPAIKTGRSEAVIVSLIANAPEVRDVLSEYIRKMPKKKEEMTVSTVQ